MPDHINHLPIGTIIGNGKYKIIRFIAAGGFGCTYEAEFLMMRTRVAIKEFYVSSMCNRQASGVVSVGAISQAGLVEHLEEKFVREAQSLYNLTHPNIVSVKDVFKEFGTSYYVMDFIDGQSLQSIINQHGPVPETQALKYIDDVMNALEYVHSQKILHLDLKPDNIMIDGNGRAILIDFGVSKQYDEVDGHNTSNILGQTTGYAPIEQMGNSIASFAPSTDIYALGATLYAALTGQTPPSAANLFAGTATLQPLPPHTSPQTVNAITLMMQPKASNRPQSIGEVRFLLAQKGQPQPPRPNPNPPYSGRNIPNPPYRGPQPPRPPYVDPRPPRVPGGLRAGKIIFLILSIILSVLLLLVYFISVVSDSGPEAFLVFLVLCAGSWTMFGIFCARCARAKNRLR